MKLTNNIVHSVAVDTFVMSLHDLEIVDTTVKFMVIKDQKRNVLSSPSFPINEIVWM